VNNNLKLFWHNIKKEKLLSVSNLLVMTSTFLLLGVFINIVVFSQTALKYLENQAQITIFFKDEFTEEKIKTYQSELHNDPRIMDVSYVSKEDALRIFREMNKDEPILLENISASVLPASLEVKTKDITQLKNISEEFIQKEGVEDVQFFEDVIQRFSVWSRTVYIIGFILVLVFLIVSYSVVVSTIRTSINNRGEELSIMKLVGASDEYVKKPFIYQGVFFGVLSSFIASIIVFLLDLTADKLKIFSDGLSLGFIPGFFISPLIFSLILCFVLILSGFLLGLLGSTTVIKKYLQS